MNTLAMGVQTTVPETISFDGDLFELWKEHTDVRGGTLKTYIKSLKHFKSWIADNNIIAPKYRDIKNYREQMEQNGISTATINLRLSAVKNFFAFLEDYEIYPDVAFKVKGIRDNSKMFKRDILNDEEVKTLIESFNRTTIQGKRDLAMFLLMLTAGLRTIEVKRANIEDFTRRNGAEVLLIQGKGHNSKNDSTDALPIITIKALRDYLDARTDNYTPKSPLFISYANHRTEDNRLSTDSISRVVRLHYRAIGIDRPNEVTAHSLRHTFAVKGFELGQSVEEVQTSLRHTNSDTTRMYLHNIEKAKNKTSIKVGDYYSSLL